MSFKEELGKVIQTLLSDTSDLRQLALDSGRDPFKFYQGADLSRLKLNGFDLSGLNFEGADFREADLSDVAFDAGALNGAILDERFGKYQDNFEFFIDDIFSANRYGLYYFARFRTSSLEKAIGRTSYYYNDFARFAEISAHTLRKARRCQIVSWETATSICSTLIEAWTDEDVDGILVDDPELRQPFIEFLDLSPSGKFYQIKRRDFLEVYHPKIVEEQEAGPLSRPSFRTTFAIEQIMRNNQFIFMDF